MILKSMCSLDLLSKTDEDLVVCLVNMDSFDWKNDDYQLRLSPFNVWGLEPYLMFICRFPVNYLNPKLYTILLPRDLKTKKSAILIHTHIHIHTHTHIKIKK